MLWPFKVFLIGHIITGAFGLVVFWVPVSTKKGAAVHRRWGLYFAYSMLITGALAMGMSISTLIDPLGTHPKMEDAALVRGLFGWMMIYLSILTISLAWYGLKTIRNKFDRVQHRRWVDVGLQIAVMVTAANCTIQGIMLGQPIMMGISIVGLASGITNLFFIYRTQPAQMDYLKEHVKASVGAGISVYTAFLAFGAVQLMPSQAFNLYMWAFPIVVGISIILYHHRKITLTTRGRETAMAD